MRNLRRTLGALAAGVVLLLLGDAPAMAADADLVLRGDAKCTACHDQNSSASVLTIGQTRHGVRADGRTPTCTSCHGASDRHMADPGGTKPDRTFAGVGKVGVEEQAGACLTCHQGDASRMLWAGGPHQTNDVVCSSCHKIHAPKDPVLSKATQFGVCSNCHKEQRAQMSRISHHPVPEGKMACSSCHNPHGGKGPSNLKEATVNETCYNCHAEKRGPFLIEHPPAREDCTTCHQPHGSNNTPMLKVRVPWLCQSCHFAQFHPSTAYGGQQVPPTGVAQQLLAKGCANCHQQVHGSNHPSGWRWTR